MNLLERIDHWATVSPKAIAHVSDARALTYGELRAQPHSDPALSRVQHQRQNPRDIGTRDGMRRIPGFLGRHCHIGRSAIVEDGVVLGDKSVVTDYSRL